MSLHKIQKTKPKEAKSKTKPNLKNPNHKPNHTKKTKPQKPTP